MSLLGPSWTTAAGAVALSALIAGGAGFFKGMSYEKDKAAVALAKAVDKARQREQNWQSDAQTIEEVHANELRRVADQHVRDLDRLRNRAPSRMPAASSCTADGAGSTGRQLSQPDADFLVGLAADADRTAADLRACQAWVKAVTQP